MHQVDPARSGYTGPDMRVAPRSDCYCRLPVTTVDLRQHIVTVVNISADGLLFRLDTNFELEDRITFKMPVIGAVPGTVIWSLGGKTGVQFDDSIEPRDYLPLLKALGGRPAEQ